MTDSRQANPDTDPLALIRPYAPFHVCRWSTDGKWHVEGNDEREQRGLCGMCYKEDAEILVAAQNLALSADAEIAALKAHVAALEQEIEKETYTRGKYIILVQGVAKALGLRTEGEVLDSLHDVAERVAALVAERDALASALDWIADHDAAYLYDLERQEAHVNWTGSDDVDFATVPAAEPRQGLRDVVAKAQKQGADG